MNQYENLKRGNNNNNMAKILVVDDELDMCQIISDILKEEGYSVYCSYDGEDTLMKIKKNHYDLMVLDYKLNEMSGLMVLEKALQIIPSLKVIMISAFADKSVKARARKLGVGDFLDKPFDLKRFTQGVQDILTKKTNKEKLQRRITISIKLYQNGCNSKSKQNGRVGALCILPTTGEIR